jgi:hypothetical protein
MAYGLSACSRPRGAVLLRLANAHAHARSGVGAADADDCAGVHARVSTTRPMVRAIDSYHDAGRPIWQARTETVDDAQPVLLSRGRSLLNRPLFPDPVSTRLTMAQIKRDANRLHMQVALSVSDSLCRRFLRQKTCASSSLLRRKHFFCASSQASHDSQPALLPASGTHLTACSVPPGATRPTFCALRPRGTDEASRSIQSSGCALDGSATSLVSLPRS